MSNVIRIAAAFAVGPFVHKIRRFKTSAAKESNREVSIQMCPPPLISIMLLLTGSAASAQSPGSWVYDPIASSVTGTITETSHGVSRQATPTGDYVGGISDPLPLSTGGVGGFGGGTFPPIDPTYQASVSISGSRTYTIVFRWLDSDRNTAADPPKNACFQLDAEAGTGILVHPGGFTMRDGTADDGLGDTQQFSFFGFDEVTQYRSAGRHLITMDGSSGVVTITRTLSVNLSSGENGLSEGFAHTHFGATPSEHGAIVVPLGYEQTYQRVESSGTGAFGVPAATRQLNVAQNGNTLRADVMLPYVITESNDPNLVFNPLTITYQPQIFGQAGFNDPNSGADYGDTYNWKFSHPSRTDSGDLPSALYGYNVPSQDQFYKAPVIRIKALSVPEPVSVTPNDAAEKDNVDFSYTFVNYGATADYHLKMNFHQQYEKWVQGRSDEQPVTEKEISPVWFPAGTSQIVQPPDQAQISLLTANFSNATSVASALAGSNPAVGAIILALGLAANANAPTQQTYADNDSAFASAVMEAQNGSDPARFDPPNLCADITPANMLERHGEFEWQLFLRTYSRIEHWVGDEYDASGFKGQVYAHFLNPYSVLPVMHYRRKAGPTPNHPNAPIINGSLNFNGIAGNAQAQNVTFTFRAADGTPDTTITILVPASGAYSLIGFPDTAGILHIKPDKYLAVNLPVDLSGGDMAGINATFDPGDADNNNRVDVLDFGILINAYGSAANDPVSGYDPNADFNGDGVVDVLDFGLFTSSNGQQGDI